MEALGGVDGENHHILYTTVEHRLDDDWTSRAGIGYPDIRIYPDMIIKNYPLSGLVISG